MSFQLKRSLFFCAVILLLVFPLTAVSQNRFTKAPDLNGDGKSDLLWRNQTLHQSTAWLMDGLTQLSSIPLLDDVNWKVSAYADFNGDNRSDLFFTNPSTGQMVIWLMNGTSVSSWSLVLTDPTLQLVDVADLNGDGFVDAADLSLWIQAFKGS